MVVSALVSSQPSGWARKEARERKCGSDKGASREEKPKGVGEVRRAKHGETSPTLADFARLARDETLRFVTKVRRGPRMPPSARRHGRRADADAHV
jgi:hypothetical protein